MDKDIPRVDRIDGLLWLAIAVLLPVVYLMTTWVFENNSHANNTADSNTPGAYSSVASEELD